VVKVIIWGIWILILIWLVVVGIALMYDYLTKGKYIRWDGVIPIGLGLIGVLYYLFRLIQNKIKERYSRK
jgi:hypothetical protein